MAAAEGINRQQGKAAKKKPFAWVKKLAHLGGSRDTNGERKKSPKKVTQTSSAPPTAAVPQSQTNSYANGQADGVDGRLRDAEQRHEEAHLRYQLPPVGTSEPITTPGTHSAAPTVNTNGTASDAGQSKSGTTSGNTVEPGDNSIFSSSNHSARSLTTTLTTIQSSAPQGTSQVQTPGQASAYSAHHSQQPSQGSTYFSHQYPTAPVASAVPAHVTGTQSSHLPTTYRSATANNLLSDNASVMTLASSHHNRRVGDRRNSADTNASVRAIPPSSQWGGSRESLPLSTISVPAADSSLQQLGAGQAPGASNLYQQTGSRPSIGGLASTERQSIYSSTAMTPTGTAQGHSSERNSLYASSRTGVAADNASTRGLVGDANSIRGPLTDGASIREASIRGGQGTDSASVHSSMLGGHGRNDSNAGSIGAMASTPTAARSGDPMEGSEGSRSIHLVET